jgi:hypothetical protein
VISHPTTIHDLLMRLSLASLLLAAIVSRAHAQTPRDLTPFLIPDRAAEVALARSAAPAAVSDPATVLVLTRQGYVEAAKGTNGFTCLVVRAFGGPMDSTTWGQWKVRAPHCLNPAAVRSILPDITLRSQLIAAGTPAAEVERRMHAEYASGRVPAAAPGAMAYMMSPDQYLSDAAPHWLPHVMFYYGPEHHAAEFGAGDFGAPVILGGTDERGVVIFIPTPRWSDGTPAGVSNPAPAGR